MRTDGMFCSAYANNQSKVIFKEPNIPMVVTMQLAIKSILEPKILDQKLPNL